jgi:zinc transport system ATP-binding protein
MDLPVPRPEDTTAQTLLRLDGVGVRRGPPGRERWLVRDIDLSVRRGEIVSLIGPNGAGKSTVVRTAVGVLHPDAGQVRRAAELRIGYVPQSPSIDSTLPLTVKRFMTLTQRHPRAAIREALAEVGIAHLADAELHTLSGGEFQRALIARALVRRPDLLVLDEPVQGVDFAGEIALYDLIRAIRDRLNCGILLISHDLHIVMAATDTVVCLNGHVCCTGTPKAVSEAPAYRQLFGSRAAEHLAVYHHRHDHSHDIGGAEVLGHGQGESAGEDGGAGGGGARRDGDRGRVVPLDRRKRRGEPHG